MEKTKTQDYSSQKSVLSSLQKPVIKKTHEEILEEYFIALTLQGKMEELLVEAMADDLIRTPVLKKIALQIMEFLKENKEFEGQIFVSKLPSELHEIFNNLYLVDMGDKMEDNDWLEKELRKTTLELKKENFQVKLKSLSSEMTKQERGENPEETKKLEVEFKKISQGLTDLLEKQDEPRV